MAQVHELVLNNIPAKRRQSPRGWILFNAVCCHHRGHSVDKRHRGNLMVSADGVIGYNCYNCGFKTRFDNIELSKNFELLLNWLGVPHEDIQQAKLELLKNKIDGVERQGVNELLIFNRKFKEVNLPPGAATIESITEWEDIPNDYFEVVSYLLSRGSAVANNYDYHWTSSTKHDMNHRVIIPFYYDNQIVGWTARYAGTPPHGTPRYYNSELQPGYLFNNEALDNPNRKYVLLVEGPFDAIAVDGVAVLGSELSKDQLAWLLQCDKEIVVVPDRQRKNQGLIDAALDNNWAVSFPEWEDSIKDSAQASARYGKIYTLRSILANKTASPLQINVKRQMFKG